MWSAPLRLRLASLAALVLAAPALAAAADADADANATAPAYRVNGWYPCSYSSANGEVDSSSFDAMTVFDCAEIEVPLCYEGVCESDRKINFFVKRLVADTPPPEGTQRKALIVIDGGPGYAATGMESVMDAMYKQLGDSVDYYTFDHRGTGRSEFLQCDAAQALTSGSPGGQELSLDELDSCFQDLNFQYEDQAAAFSTTSAAMDVKALIETFLSEHHVYVAGYSYGTYLAQRILQLDIPQVVGYIFDGVDVLSTKEDPLESANSHWNEALHDPARRLLEFCYDDKNCFFKFKSRETVLEDAIAFLDKLDQEVDTNKCAQVLAKGGYYLQPSVALRVYMGNLVTDITGRVDALTVLSSVQRCNHDDLSMLKEVFLGEYDFSTGGESRSKLPRFRGDIPDPLNDVSSLLYDVIVFSERWSQPAPTKAERDTFFLDGVFSTEDSSTALAYCVFTGRHEPACDELRDKLPKGTNQTFFYEHDEILQRPLVLPPHASALILNGGLDFQTPKEFGELLYHKLSGSGKGVMMVNFDYGVHCSGEMVADHYESPCHDGITAAFIAHDGDVAKIDTSCMKSLPNTRFG